jgi:hypothetical protein
MTNPESKEQDPRNTRQAVLVIHGIGEQIPMATLDGFVEAVWTSDSSLHRPHKKGAYSWRKPYTLSENFELRRITTSTNVAGIRTDFFEFYWQHLMHGTKVSHVINWARKLLVRNPATVPKHLVPTYFLLVFLALVGLFMGYQGYVSDDKTTTWLSYTISLAIVPTIMGVIKGIIGDAARYLDPAPTNIQRRHAIRSAGIKVIKALHDEGYDRIVVAGHSLGSVIGYDMLTHAWVDFYRKEPTNDDPSYTELNNLEEIAREQLDNPSSYDNDDIQITQRRYFNELRDNGCEWRVTDFITLGSPLAHAEILLARNSDDLYKKINDRELPTCLPVLEESQVDHSTRRHFSYPANRPNRKPHFAAVFAPTRWTNLFFPNHFIIWGDLVGGRIAQIFGSGIKDIPVTIEKNFGIFSHTYYWRPHGEENQHIETLRESLDLRDKRSG